MGNDSKGRIIVGREDRIPFMDVVSDKLRRVNLGREKKGQNQKNGKIASWYIEIYNDLQNIMLGFNK